MFTKWAAQHRGAGMSLVGTLRQWAIPLFCAAILVFNIIVPAVADDTINVTFDHDLIIQLPSRVATLVIGNPLIADATVVAGNKMVITGKSFGMTNIIILDRIGTVLAEKSVLVRPPDDRVIAYYGSDHLPNKTVHVRGYTRRDGVHVDSYDRSPPGQGSDQRPPR